VEHKKKVLHRIIILSTDILRRNILLSITGNTQKTRAYTQQRVQTSSQTVRDVQTVGECSLRGGSINPSQKATTE
jgi:hypothetical protein